jgi:hypothetical protein
MTPLRLLVNAIVGGFLLFAWANSAPLLLGGEAPASGFLVQYLACCASALLAGWFLWLAAPRVRSFSWRVVFVASLGLFAGLVADLPLWNRGELPGLWLARRISEHVCGFTLVGFFLAWRMKTYRFVPAKPPRP